MNPARDAIAVEHVVKSFPQRHDVIAWLRTRGRLPRHRVINDVTFSVGAGELFGLLGENGAGKSTVLHMLSGLVSPDSGTIRIGEVGVCSAEERSFYYRLTARRNLRFFATLAGVKRAETDARVEDVARLVDLSAVLDRKFETFSSGMRQRLAIARALLADPPILLLDEPTRAVDPIHAREIRTLIRSLVQDRGKTIVLCTNLLEEAWELCDRVAVIARGRIVAVERPEELVARSRTRRYSIVLDRTDPGLLARVRAVAGLDGVSVEPQPAGVALVVQIGEGKRTLTDVLQAVSSNGVSVEDVTAETPDVFRIYAELAGRG